MIIIIKRLAYSNMTVITDPYILNVKILGGTSIFIANLTNKMGNS